MKRSNGFGTAIRGGCTASKPFANTLILTLNTFVEACNAYTNWGRARKQLLFRPELDGGCVRPIDRLPAPRKGRTPHFTSPREKYKIPQLMY
jgi:hypothetical protein